MACHAQSNAASLGVQLPASPSDLHDPAAVKQWLSEVRAAGMVNSSMPAAGRCSRPAWAVAARCYLPSLGPAHGSVPCTASLGMPVSPSPCCRRCRAAWPCPRPQSCALLLAARGKGAGEAAWLPACKALEAYAHQGERFLLFDCRPCAAPHPTHFACAWLHLRCCAVLRCAHRVSVQLLATQAGGRSAAGSATVSSANTGGAAPGWLHTCCACLTTSNCSQPLVLCSCWRRHQPA